MSPPTRTGNPCRTTTKRSARRMSRPRRGRPGARRVGRGRAPARGRGRASRGRCIRRALQAGGHGATRGATVTRSLGSGHGAAPRPTSCSRAAASRASAWPVPWPRSRGRATRSRGSPAPPRARSSPRSLVALQRAGEPLERLEDVARTLDYRRLRDRGSIGRVAGPFAKVVDGLSLAFDGGIFEGDYLRAWLKGVLGRPRRPHVRRPAQDRRRRLGRRSEHRYAPGRHRERRVAAAARAAALGLPGLRTRPRRAGGRRRGTYVRVDPVLLRADDPAVERRRRRIAGVDPGRRQRAVQLPGRAVRPHRRPSRRGGRRSASGSRCVRTAGCRRPR